MDAGLGVYGRNHGLDPNLWTFDLLPGSPAIDGAYPDSMIVYDERSFYRGVDGDGDGFGWNDIGAYELQCDVLFSAAGEIDRLMTRLPKIRWSTRRIFILDLRHGDGDQQD